MGQDFPITNGSRFNRCPPAAPVTRPWKISPYSFQTVTEFCPKPEIGTSVAMKWCERKEPQDHKSRWTMSMSAVSASSAVSQSMQAWQAKAQKIQSEFQQLGQDLQTGNLSQAKTDYSTLSRNLPTAAQTSGPISQAFGALGTALQSGNLTAAQSAYSTVQQDVQQAADSLQRNRPVGGPQKSNPRPANLQAQQLGSSSLGTPAANSSLMQIAGSTLSQAFQSYMLGSSATALSVARGLSSLA